MVQPKFALPHISGAGQDRLHDLSLWAEERAMTNHRGKYFISYRRSPARPNGTQEAVLVVRDALRDRGAPTWRDLDNLASEPAEDELVATLTKGRRKYNYL